MWGKYPSQDLDWGLAVGAGEMEQQSTWVMLGHGYHREAAVQENNKGWGQEILGQVVKRNGFSSPSSGAARAWRQDQATSWLSCVMQDEVNL